MLDGCHIVWWSLSRRQCWVSHRAMVSIQTSVLAVTSCGGLASRRQCWVSHRVVVSVQTSVLSVTSCDGLCPDVSVGVTSCDGLCRGISAGCHIVQCSLSRRQCWVSHSVMVSVQTSVLGVTSCGGLCPDVSVGCASRGMKTTVTPPGCAPAAAEAPPSGCTSSACSGGLTRSRREAAPRPSSVRSAPPSTSSSSPASVCNCDWAVAD